jgi:hypothetical protein
VKPGWQNFRTGQMLGQSTFHPLAGSLDQY